MHICVCLCKALFVQTSAHPARNLEGGSPVATDFCLTGDDRGVNTERLPLTYFVSSPETMDLAHPVASEKPLKVHKGMTENCHFQ